MNRLTLTIMDGNSRWTLDYPKTIKEVWGFIDLFYRQGSGVILSSYFNRNRELRNFETVDTVLGELRRLEDAQEAELMEIV